MTDTKWRSPNGHSIASDVTDKLPPYTHPENVHAETPAPQGWKLVPIEPTEEMSLTFRREWQDMDIRGKLRSEMFKAAYKALLSAAPTPAPTDGLLPWKCNCCHTKFQSAQRDRTDDGLGNGGAKCPRCKADGQYTYRDYSNPVDDLKAVLCDPEGKCCISGSNADRQIVDNALSDLQAAPTEKVERIEGLEDDLKNNITTNPDGTYMVEQSILDAARAYLNLQSGETEKVEGVTEDDIPSIIIEREKIFSQSGETEKVDVESLKQEVEKCFPSMNYTESSLVDVVIDHLANTGRLR